MATFDLTPVPVDNPEDNLALTYVQKKETEEIQELERESAPFPTGDAEPEKEEKLPIKGSDDPWQLRIFRNIVDVSDKVISDVVRGLPELPTAPAHGAVEGAKETLIALNNLGGWLTNALDVQGNLITPAAQTNEQAEASGTPKETLSKTSEDLRDIPNFPEPETVT